MTPDQPKSTFEQAFYDRQATRVAELAAQNRILEGRLRYLEFYEKPGRYYMEMQKATMKDERLLEIWNNFIVFWKLSGAEEFDAANSLTDIDYDTYCKTCNQKIYGK